MDFSDPRRLAKAKPLQHHRRMGTRVLTSAVAVLVFASCNGGVETGARSLVAACVPTPEDAPPHAWFCGESRVAECESVAGGDVDYIFVTASAGVACVGPLDVSE